MARDHFAPHIEMKMWIAFYELFRFLFPYLEISDNIMGGEYIGRNIIIKTRTKMKLD